MTTHASGTFEVNLNPQTPDDKTEGATLSRMSIDKQFHGDLEATSKGEMLTAVTGVKGSAGYVAIERVSGTLHGRSGSFVFQHSGTLTRGTQQLSITVVPDSGTDQLMGLAGKMAIKIADGKHSYDFEYTLAETP
jgi:predicted flavoprotein YhiN